MIPLTFLYDEYIDRPKLSEQKNPFEYIVPPPTSGVGTINHLNSSNLISPYFQKFSTDTRSQKTDALNAKIKS